MRPRKDPPDPGSQDTWEGAAIGLKISLVLFLMGKAIFDAGDQSNYWIFLSISSLLGGIFVYRSNRSRGMAGLGMAIATTVAIFSITFPACWSVGCVASFSY